MSTYRNKALTALLRWIAPIMICGWLASGIALGQTAPSAASSKGEQTTVFPGGCFWGADAVFKHVKGVSKVVSGYAVKILKEQHDARRMHDGSETRENPK